MTVRNGLLIITAGRTLRAHGYAIEERRNKLRSQIL